MSLGKKATVGILWNLADQFARRGISIFVTLILAKFLAPEDYGLVAMMAVFIALGQSLMDSGFREALIRLENISTVDYSTAFYANIFLGVISYGFLFVAAPYIADFYDESRLIDLIRVASLTVVVMSFQIVQVASLSRKLNFKAQLKASFPASIISGGLAVVLAYCGAGVWALVAQMIVNAVVHTALLWLMEGWRPTRQFGWSSLRGMYNFGYKLFLSGALDTIFQNLYVIVIAKVFSVHLAGLYFFANKIKELLVQQIVQAIQKVTYPALASVQGESKKLKDGYKKIVILMTAILFPVILFVGAIAQPLFELFLPEKWYPAVPYFQLLCCASVLLPLHSVNVNILKVKGRSDLFLYLEIIKKSFNALVLFGTYRYGIEAIILGQIITSVINYIPNSYFSSKLIGYSVREQVADFMPTLLVAVFSAVIGFYIVETVDTHPLVLVVTLPVFMSLAYILLSFVFNRSIYLVVLRYFSGLIGSRVNGMGS